MHGEGKKSATIQRSKRLVYQSGEEDLKEVLLLGRDD